MDDELPVEIIKLEILPRVPAKSLFRFKCVCKDWLSFLSTKEFAQRQLLESRKHQKLLLVDPQSSTFHTLDCEAPNHQTTLRSINCIPFGAVDDDSNSLLFLASLDGLICLGVDNTLTFMLWNPLTGAYKKLSSKYHCSYDSYWDVVGFYVDDSSNDYKLLHVNRSYDNNDAPCIRAYIYSLRSDRWRRIEFLENAQRIFDCDWTRHTVFSNNSLYFTAGQHEDGGERMVICFDVKSEKFREIQFPRNVPSDASECCWDLVDVNDSIHLYYGYMFRRDTLLKLYVNSEIGLWRLMEDDHQWKKVASFIDIHIDAPALWFDWYPMYLMNKNYEDWLVISEYRDDLVEQTNIYRIDFKTKDHVDLCGSGVSMVSGCYIESFVSPNP